MIRDYQEGDLVAAVELFTAAVHELTAGHYDQRQRDAWAPRPPDLTYWRARYAAMHVVLAEHDGALAGMIGYHQNGHVDLLFTHPAFARQGVASQLHDEVERRLGDLAGVVELFTEASEIARPFFERCGYLVERREVVQVRGAELQRNVMRKQLARG